MFESVQKVRAVLDLNGLKWAAFIQCFSCCQFTIHGHCRCKGYDLITFGIFNPYRQHGGVVDSIVISQQEGFGFEPHG